MNFEAITLQTLKPNLISNEKNYTFNPAFLHWRTKRPCHNSWVGISQHSSPESSITGADCFLNHGEGLTIDLGSDNCTVTNSLFNENNVSTRGLGGEDVCIITNNTINKGRCLRA